MFLVETFLPYRYSVPPSSLVHAD